MLKLSSTEKDKPAFEKITHIKVDKSFTPDTSITVDLTFGPNDYFTNDTLSFTCIMTPDEKRCKEIIG